MHAKFLVGDQTVLIKAAISKDTNNVDNILIYKTNFQMMKCFSAKLNVRKTIPIKYKYTCSIKIYIFF